MPSYKSLLTTTILALLISSSFQDCIHDHMEHPTLEYVSIDSSEHSHSHSHDHDHDHRHLQTTWNNIRIHADYTLLNGNATTDEYLITQVMPAAIDFWTATLKVQPLVNPLTLTTNVTCSNIPTPAALLNGVETDFYLILKGTSQTASWVASASACTLLSSTKRPVVATINFNYNFIFPTNSAGFDFHLATTLHEFTHTLGFSFSLYEKMPTNPVFANYVANNVTSFIFSGEPINQRLRDHFGCQNIPGAILEQQGGLGSVASHFERRIFANEMMTASAQKDMRITEFTLALLESSGWYQVDYSLAEPFYFGKGKGCSFYTEKCMTNGVANYPEYCSNIAEYGCTFHGRLGAYCGNLMNSTRSTLNPGWNYWGNNRVVDDPFADNCPMMTAFNTIDCEDPAAVSRRMISGESYGKGSKCFIGTLYPSSALRKKLQYCMKYQCETNQTDGSYYLRLFVGSNNITCSSAGSYSVPGYAGKIDCPDPQSYCSTVGIQFCRRGCNGRGTCQADGTCLCNPGFTGTDCGYSVVANLVAPENKTPPKTETVDVGVNMTP